jgi:hypothetical protein
MSGSEESVEAMPVEDETGVIRAIMGRRGNSGA